MIKKANAICHCLLGVLTAVSCSTIMEDSSLNAPCGDREIRFGVSLIDIETKAFSESTNATLRSQGFQVAAVIDDGNDVMFNNAVAFSNGAYTVPGEHYYFPVSGSMSFYGVYPVQAVSVSSGIAALSYSHDTDNDLIVAKATEVTRQSATVMMTFEHALSQVSINARGNDPKVDYKLVSASLSAPAAGIYTYADGKWAPSSSITEYSIYNNPSGMAISTEAMTPVGSPMSIIPGRIELNAKWKCYNRGTSLLISDKDVTVAVTISSGVHTSLNLNLPLDSSEIKFDSTVNPWIPAIQEIDMDEDYKPDFISGVFTVNNSGKKVKFTKGSLYWNGREFRCEAHQYDYPTTWIEDHIGHFHWSKDARVAYSEDYSTANTTYSITPATTDTFFAADGSAIKGCTVLAREEWAYLLSNALAKNLSSQNPFTIAGKKCVILKPDGFDEVLQDSYTASEWAAMEDAYGLVALPFAGKRIGTTITKSNTNAYIWTSSTWSGDTSKCWHATLDNGGAYTTGLACSEGATVRLVTICTE